MFYPIQDIKGTMRNFGEYSIWAITAEKSLLGHQSNILRYFMLEAVSLLIILKSNLVLLCQQPLHQSRVEVKTSRVHTDGTH